jgi:hypothetical protein
MLNALSCVANKANTGGGLCPLHVRPEGFIETGAKEFSAAELADLITTLTTGTKNNDASLRFYPFPRFIDCEVTGGDTNEVEFANSQKVVTWENDYILNAKFYEHGLPVNDALRTRNGGDVTGLIYGKNNGKYVIVGAKVDGKYKGVTITNFWCKAQGMRVFKTQNEYAWGGNVTVSQLNDNNIWFFETTSDPNNIKGLKNVDMEVVPTGANPISASGVVNVTVKQRGFGEDYVANSAYATALITPALFTGRNKATGAAVTLTGTSISGNLLSFDFDNLDPDYPAIGSDLEIVAPTVSALQTAGIPNSEIFNLTVRRTV